MDDNYTPDIHDLAFPDFVPPTEVDPSAVIVCEEGCTVHDHDDDSGDYATYADAPANLNEDDELPPYSVYARYYQTDKPLKYPVLACGHKFRGQFEPSHRNCERCWFTYFQVNGELTQSVEEAFAAGGPTLINQLKTKTFTHNFRKFMSTIAFLKQQQELAAAKENIAPNESTTGLGSNLSLREDETPAYIGGGSQVD